MASTQSQEIGCGAEELVQAEDEVPSPTSKEYQLKKYLLLLATLVVAVTYAAGLNLPGGVRQDDDTKHGHHAGDLILLYTNHPRYLAFYYCNATAFAASVVVCLLLLILQESNNGVCGTALRVVMVLDLLGLMGAYAAGSCRDAFTTIYSTLVMSVVLAYAVLAFSLYIISKLEKCKGVKHQPEDQDHESQSQSQSQSQSRHEEVASSEVLMLLATFVVTITYGAGLSPPGGFWSDGDRASLPILQDHNSARYRAFFVCNATAFVASLLIIMLLLDKRLKKKFYDKITVRFVALYGLIVVALFGLVGAYAAGSCREIDHTIYVVSLIGAVLAYIFLQVAITKGIKEANPQKEKELQGVDLFFNRDRGLSLIKNKKDEVGLEKAHELVILLATLVASVSYQAGLDPPGGLWPDTQDGHHKVGDPVLLTTHPQRYKVFFYSNSAAFVASLVVILMVKCEFPVMHRSLEAAMLVDLFGLIVAYAAGCCREVSTSIYVVALAGAVLVYVVIHIIFLTLDQDSNNSAGEAHELDSKREVLLLLAILGATVTYQAGLTPPGGFWSADKLGHHAGYPVLQNKHPSHYKVFFYCNAASFMASVALIVLLVNKNLYRPGIRCYAFFVCMVVGLFGLMGAYAAGSSRQLKTSIYVLVVFALVFTCVTLRVVILFIHRLMEHRHNKGDGPAIGDAAVGPTDNTDASPEQDNENKEKEKKNKMREYLMLLGVLAASVAYQSGLKPPGGLWDDNKSGPDGHSASNSILHDIDKSRYHTFFYSNSTSFMVSIVVIVLLLPFAHDELPPGPLHMAILLDLVGLLIAYAAGSTRDWEMFRNVIGLVIPLLVYIASYALYSLVIKKKVPRQNKNQEESAAHEQGDKS